jgi:hypothetical protein
VVDFCWLCLEHRVERLYVFIICCLISKSSFGTVNIFIEPGVLINLLLVVFPKYSSLEKALSESEKLFNFVLIRPFAGTGNFILFVY